MTKYYDEELEAKFEKNKFMYDKDGVLDYTVLDLFTQGYFTGKKARNKK